IMSPRMLAVFQPADQCQDTDSPYSTIMSTCEQCDVVLVEGDSQVNAPKIEVWRKVISTLPLAAQDRSIVAVVSDDELELATTRWSRTDIRVLADWILAMIRTWRQERSTADAVMSD
ncbi:MAG: molybdopterin-guanine dinucleotide biosynthesis protein MobB, partial [Planctomycetaceae bacterium]